MKFYSNLFFIRYMHIKSGINKRWYNEYHHPHAEIVKDGGVHSKVAKVEVAV